MENVLYRSVIVHMKDSSDGETPTTLELTTEANCFIAWFDSAEERRLEKWFSLYERDKAIEWCVEYAKRLKEQALEAHNER